jgi:hypothetical protein
MLACVTHSMYRGPDSCVCRSVQLDPRMCARGLLRFVCDMCLCQREQWTTRSSLQYPVARDDYQVPDIGETAHRVLFGIVLPWMQDHLLCRTNREILFIRDWVEERIMWAVGERVSVEHDRDLIELPYDIAYLLELPVDPAVEHNLCMTIRSHSTFWNLTLGYLDDDYWLANQHWEYYMRRSRSMHRSMHDELSAWE